MSWDDDERDRPRRGYVNSREFFFGAVVVLIGVLLAYSIALNFVG